MEKAVGSDPGGLFRYGVWQAVGLYGQATQAPMTAASGISERMTGTALLMR